MFTNVLTFPIPQGGWKGSGVGARLGGAHGIRKYCRPQAITATRLAPRSEPLWYPYTAFKGKLFLRVTRFLFARDWRSSLETVIQRSVGELLERGRPPKRPQPTGLDAAERHRRLVVDGRVVDVADAALDPLRELERGRYVLREDRRRQAVLGVVGDPHRLVGPSTVDDRHHRPERLLPVDPHLRRHAGEHGRREHGPSDVPPASAVAPLALASSTSSVTCCMAASLTTGPTIVPASNGSPTVSARARAASLGEEHRRPTGRRRSARSTCRSGPACKNAPKLAAAAAAFEVGVVEHDQRRLAAELEQRALEVAAGLLGDDRADLRRAGEVDPSASCGCAISSSTTSPASFGVVGDQVDDAGGEAGVDERTARSRRGCAGTAQRPSARPCCRTPAASPPPASRGSPARSTARCRRPRRPAARTPIASLPGTSEGITSPTSA